MAKKTITIKNAKFYKPKSKGSKKGTKIEMEHTPQKKVAKIISGNHEDEAGSGYYGKDFDEFEKKVKSKFKKRNK
jgi:hypothetical protein